MTGNTLPPGSSWDQKRPAPTGRSVLPREDRHSATDRRTRHNTSKRRARVPIRTAIVLASLTHMLPSTGDYYRWQRMYLPGLVIE